jgi:hypothetical protein
LSARGGRKTGDEQCCYGAAKDRFWHGHERSSLVLWLWAPPPASGFRITNSRLSRTLGQSFSHKRRVGRCGGRPVHIHKTISFFRFVRYFGSEPRLGGILGDNLGKKTHPFLPLFRTSLGIP